MTGIPKIIKYMDLLTAAIQKEIDIRSDPDYEPIDPDNDEDLDFLEEMLEGMEDYMDRLLETE